MIILASTKTEKQLLYYQALCDIVSIYGETEVGCSEIDTTAVAQYVASDNFFVDYFDCLSVEDLYQQLTEEIIKGFPIWRFLKISDWTKTMLDKQLQQTIIEEQQRLQKTYKCITCQYYEEINTAFGTICKCTYTNTNNSDTNNSEFSLGRKRFLRDRNVLHELKKSCKHYKPHDTPHDTHQDNLLCL